MKVLDVGCGLKPHGHVNVDIHRMKKPSKGTMIRSIMIVAVIILVTYRLTSITIDRFASDGC